MGEIASQITSLDIVYSTVYSGTDQRKHQSSASLAFVWGIHRGPVNSPHKWPVTRKMFPFDDVIMLSIIPLKITFCEMYHNQENVFKMSSAKWRPFCSGIVCNTVWQSRVFDSYSFAIYRHFSWDLTALKILPGARSLTTITPAISKPRKMKFWCHLFPHNLIAITFALATTDVFS